MAYKLAIDVQGLPALLRKLSVDETIGPPLRDGMERFGVSLESAARAAAPVGATGQLRAQLTHRLQAKPIPLWVKVKDTATSVTTSRWRSRGKTRRALASGKTLRAASRRAYKYPARIEFDRKSRHRGWLLAALKAQGAQLQSEFTAVARDIEARWGAS